MENELFSFMDDLTCLPEERPVRTSQSRASVQEVKKEAELGLLLCGSGCDWQESFSREFCFGKMLLGHFHQTEDETSMRSFEPLMRSGIAFRGEYLTLNTPEWTAGPWQSRNAGVVCGLSDVLEPMSARLQKYFLSTKALSGILHRADARGKKLPELLKTAINYMLRWWEKVA